MISNKLKHFITIYNIYINTYWLSLWGDVNLYNQTTFIMKKAERKHFYMACNEERAFFTYDVYKNYKLWSCQNV